MLKRERKAEEGAPDWVVSYGDCMSLLLTFFIMLFAFSTVDANKWEEIVKSFRGRLGFKYQIEDTVFTPIRHKESASSSKIMRLDELLERGRNIPIFVKEKPETPQTPIEEPEDPAGLINQGFEELYADLMDALNEKGYKYDVDIIKYEDAIILRFKNKILFESGIADLDQEANIILFDLLEIISDYERVLDKLVIEGNTDNVPINTLKYRDNFELSIYRALNVFYFIQNENLFPGNKVEIKGYGENNPIASNQTEEGRALNRRTDMVITKAEVKE